MVHTLPSVHGAPPPIPAYTQPVVALQPSLVQALLSLQTTGVPTHCPAEQLSAVVQTLPSVQLPPTTATYWQMPPLQLSVVQVLVSEQSLADPTQVPAPLQTSETVQPLPSSHARVLLAFLQPVVGEQLSVVQGLPSSQVTAEPPLQAPPEQASFKVHGLLSLHVKVLEEKTQPTPVWQLSVVQGLLSVHSEVPLPLHCPALQTSVGVQGSLSVQLAVLLT
jgi:hypothetical protein